MERIKRLSINITDEQAKKLNNAVRWGERRAVFDTVIEDLFVIAESNPRDIDDLVKKRKHIWELRKEE